MTGWRLDSAEERAARFPGSFELPPQPARMACRPGDYVKLIFIGTDGFRERIWVRVETAESGRYTGTLANSPLSAEVLPALGTRVSFGYEHICDIREQS